MGGKTFLGGEYICIWTFLSSHSPIRNLQSFIYPGLKKKNESLILQQKKSAANSQFDDKYMDYKKWDIGR